MRSAVLVSLEAPAAVQGRTWSPGSPWFGALIASRRVPGAPAAVVRGPEPSQPSLGLC